ncbi:hypothetical protein HDU76_007159, partial [Blyttiomyces sp. JEL0837]
MSAITTNDTVAATNETGTRPSSAFSRRGIVKVGVVHVDDIKYPSVAVGRIHLQTKSASKMLSSAHLSKLIQHHVTAPPASLPTFIETNE